MRKVKLKYQHFHPSSLHKYNTLLLLLLLLLFFCCFFIYCSCTGINSTKKAELEGIRGNLIPGGPGMISFCILSHGLFNKKIAVTAT